MKTIIADLHVAKTAGLRGPGDVRQSGGGALLRRGGSRHGRIGGYGLARRLAPRGAPWRAAVQSNVAPARFDGLWSNTRRAGLKDLRGGGSRRGLRARVLQSPARFGEARGAAVVRVAVGRALAAGVFSAISRHRRRTSSHR